MKTAVIGAGLSGLMVATKLATFRDVNVFDKSKGVGGRLATRRTDNSKFDHGAQFYRLREPLHELHERWLKRGLVKLWFTQDGVQHFAACDGMTALAKDLAQDIDLNLNERAVRLQREGENWIVEFENGRFETVNEVILTCPVPQSLEILKTSSLEYPDHLKQITYSKALVLLIENLTRPFQFSSHGYLEPQNSLIFSISDQLEKGVSRRPALAVTLNAEFSEKHFDSPEDVVTRLAFTELKRLSPDFEPGIAQLKKWRYCQVRQSFGECFAQVSPGLYLASDGFGGASLNGAARSATALIQFLNQHSPQS